MKKTLLSLAAAVVALGAYPAHAQETWKLSTLIPLTGQYAGSADELKIGFELALEEINAAGGIKGRKVELKMYDTQSNAGQVATLIRQACSDSLAVVGPAYSNEARVAFPVANSMQCPAIAPGAAASGLTVNARPYTFSYLTPADILVPKATEAAIKVLKPKKTAVIIEDADNSSLDQGNRVMETLKKHSVDVQKLSVASNDVDFGPTVTRATADGTDSIVICTFDKAAVGVLKELKKANRKVNVMICQSAFNGTLVALGPEFVEGVYRYAEADPPTSPDPRVVAFMQKYKARSGGRDAVLVPFLTYDTLRLMKQVIETSGVKGDDASRAEDRKKIADGLAHVKDFDGIVGKGSMDPIGVMVKSVVLLKHDGTKWARVNID